MTLVDRVICPKTFKGTQLFEAQELRARTPPAADLVSPSHLHCEHYIVSTIGQFALIPFL
jgi:hypothetical protein